jgi:hypothetical protein
MFTKPYVSTMSEFIIRIGLEVEQSSIIGEEALPGIQISEGKIIVDEDRLLYPGDLLHAAGHLAVKPPLERKVSSISCRIDPAEEMMTLAWTYAAAVNLNIPPDVVFHPAGYKGQSTQIISGYQNGFYVGLPMLQWVNMSADHVRAASLGIAPFPKMIKWVRD